MKIFFKNKGKIKNNRQMNIECINLPEEVDKNKCDKLSFRKIIPTRSMNLDQKIKIKKQQNR